MLKTVSSITNAIGALNYKGTWNASTNTPTLASGVGTKGDYYVVSVAGSTTLDGISNWGVGDWAAYNGSVWQRVEGGADGNFVNLSVSGASTLASLTASTAIGTASGGTGLTSFTSTGVVYASSTSALTTDTGLTFNGTMLSSAVARFGTYTSFGTESLQVAKSNGSGVIGSAYQFAIVSKAANNRAEIILTDGVSANAFISYAPSITAASDRLSFELQGLSVLSLAGNGIVTMAGYGAGTATFSAAGVISSVSDENWKIKDGIPTNPDAMLKKLEPGYWYYNDEKKETFGTERQLGFYAQNVHQAIGEEAAPTPETYVSTDIDGAETTITKPWGYYDRSVLAVVVMSLKNALTTIEQQQTTINNLSARLTKAGF